MTNKYQGKLLAAFVCTLMFTLAALKHAYDMVTLLHQGKVLAAFV